MGVGESSGIFVKFVPMFGDDLVMGDFVVFYDVQLIQKNMEESCRLCGKNVTDAEIHTQQGCW